MELESKEGVRFQLQAREAKQKEKERPQRRITTEKRKRYFFRSSSISVVSFHSDRVVLYTRIVVVTQRHKIQPLFPEFCYTQGSSMFSAISGLLKANSSFCPYSGFNDTFSQVPLNRFRWAVLANRNCYTNVAVTVICLKLWCTESFLC